MSGHVEPHRWADAWAGRLGATERAEMNRHADGCRACARARAQVKRASDSFTTIREQPAPELPWDSVRARVHWSVSSERRARTADAAPAPRWRLVVGRLALGGLAAGAVIAALATGAVELRSSASPIVDDTGGAPVAAAPAPEALVGLVNRVTGDVLVDGLRPADLFAHRLGPGTTLATGDGRVDVQFARGGGFSLAPASRLVLRRFDATAIELVVEGTVDVEVGPRAPDQRFAVIAGDRTIEVHGTQFRVRHDRAATAVSCTRGVVAVRDASGSVAVPAERGLAAPAGRALAGAPVTALSAEELGALTAAAPLLLAVWDLEAIVRSSAPLEIAADAGDRRDVRLDGVELGAAPLRVRVMPSRHTIELADPAGRFRRAGWIDVAAPAAGAPPARFVLPAEPSPTADTGARRRQLRAGIDQRRLRQCMRQIAMQGLTGTYVQIEVAVDAAGAINVLNIVDTDLGSITAACVRGVLADVRFGPGRPATWRDRIDL